MKSIICKQPLCILNVDLWQYVKFYVVLPILFHSQSLLSQNNCLKIAYLFEKICPNCLFLKLFIQNVHSFYVDIFIFRAYKKLINKKKISWKLLTQLTNNINRKIRNLSCQSMAVTLLGLVGTWLTGNSIFQ